MTLKPKVGDIVEVEFLDHVEDGGDPICFKVWGRLCKSARQHVEILSWAYSTADEADVPSNEKRWTIVRAAIKRIIKLTPSTPHDH